MVRGPPKLLQYVGSVAEVFEHKLDGVDFRQVSKYVTLIRSQRDKNMRQITSSNRMKNLLGSRLRFERSNVK